MRVLAAVDLGPGGALALREAAALASRMNGELGAVHVVHDGPHGLFTRRGPPDRAKWERLVRRAELAVHARIDQVTGRSPTLFIEDGAEPDAIVRRSDAWRADVVVLGGWGHVGHGVLRHARCDVLVARRSLGPGPVLAAIDPSYASHRALGVAAIEARQRRTNLEVARAIGFFEVEASYLVELGTPSAYNHDQSARDAARDLLADSLAALGIDATPEIVDPPAASGIVHEVERIGAELVVVGYHGRALGVGVAEKIARTAPCSVLLVRG